MSHKYNINDNINEPQTGHKKRSTLRTRTASKSHLLLKTPQEPADSRAKRCLHYSPFVTRALVDTVLVLA
jgi:hypothetical protein